MQRVVWEERPRLRNPAAILAFEGWGDAGESSTMAARYLLDASDSVRIATIDADEFYDFQVRRPYVEVNEEGIREILWPDVEVWQVSLPWAARDLVVITGHEPHARWKVFTRDIIEILDVLGVSEVVTMGAFIGQVPHTLPVPLVGSSVDHHHLERHQLFSSDYEGPTGIIGVLNKAFSDAGHTSISVWAAVPHYLSSQEYPPGGLALLDKALEIVGVDLDTSDLTIAVAEYRQQVEEALANSDMQDYVEDLEAQTLSDDDDGNPGEQLVEEIEKYLRDS